MTASKFGVSLVDSQKQTGAQVKPEDSWAADKPGYSVDDEIDASREALSAVEGRLGL
jgi:hypothetical protein